MLATMFTKAAMDRWRAMAIATSLLGLWLFVAMAIYRDIDLSLYTDLPQALRDLMGIPDGADAAILAYNVMLTFAGSLTLAGLAVSMGSASIAGEERNGTIGLLLGNPKSRRQILISKTAAMVALIALAAIALWLIALIVPEVLGVEVGATNLGAMMIHVGVNAIFYGFVAIAIGAWTGNRTLASAVPAGLMIIGYFATGLLPLVQSLSGVAKVFPWYYFASSEPLINGVKWSHIAVLSIGIVVLGAASGVGLNKRDLRSRSVGVSLLDRLRNFEPTQKVFERLAGSTRVSRIWIKTTSEHQGLLFITVGVTFLLLGVIMGPMYNAIETELIDAAQSFPEAIMALAGGGDMSTPEGFLRVETFGLSVPIAVMIVTIVVGAKSLAGEEAARTMGLLLANPIKRSSVVLEQSVAMIVYGVAVGTAAFAGVAATNAIANLQMSYGGIFATSVLVTLLGLVFGALALAISAGTGQVKSAVFGAIGAALTSHLLNSFLPLSEDLSKYAKLTPHYYMLASDPQFNGMHWGHAALLVGFSVALIGGAVVLFERRDLRQG